MRLFIASRIEGSAVARVEEGLAPVRARVARASWVAGGSWHLTYAFLGEQDERVARTIGSRLPEALEGITRYEGALSGGGFFPDERRPKVGWLALESPAPLMRIADAVRRMLDAERVEYDRKPFRPHLTIVRIRDRWSARDVAELREACNALGRVEMSAGRVSLYRSELLPGGAKHHELAGVTLS